MYQSQNSLGGDSLSVEFDVGPYMAGKTALDKWLTERYALFQDSEAAIHSYEIHHIEWPLHQLDLRRIEVNYARFAALIGRAPDIVHYSPGVKVIAWGKKKVASE